MTRFAAAALLLASAAAYDAAVQVPDAAPAPDAIAQALFLIGDAGEPHAGGEPVLVALRREVMRSGSKATVAFLGDNLYPHGLPDATDPDFAEMARRLDDQVDAVKDTGARVIFIPGNHDWAKGRAEGLAAVRRQERRVEERGGPSVSFLPDDGCPGPAVVDEGTRLRLLALDTHWWLHPHERPEGPGSTCAAKSESDVVAGLRAALDDAAARDVVVLAHHPLQSGGPHGGKFGWKQHLFPLTEWKGGLFVPLPLVGSLYPLVRSSGISAQDVASDEYQRMREAFVSAGRGREPLAWAGGHEHILQVIESREWGRVLVSGAGIYGHVTYVKDVEGSRYGAARAGFMRIDFLRDGGRRLSVLEVDKEGGSREVFSTDVESAPTVT